MLKSIDEPNLSRPRETWEQFLLKGQIAPDLDPLVAVSWERCGPVLNPRARPQWTQLSPETLSLALERQRTFRLIARPIMEDIYQCIEGIGTCLVLVDGIACVLEVLGDPLTVRQLENEGFKTGAVLNEKFIGTTAFSIALLDSSPALVVGAEHFLECFHGYTTVASPVFDPEGRPLGAVGLIEQQARYTPRGLAMMVAASRAVENQLQAELMLREANAKASELNAALDTMSEGLLAFNPQGVITHLNERGGKLLGLVPNKVKGRQLLEYLALPEFLARAASRGEDLCEARADLVLNGVPQEFLVSLRVIGQKMGGSATFIMTFRGIEQVHRLVTRFVGAQAHLTLDDMVGRGPAMRQVRKQVMAAANAKGCVLLTGEPGTSKSAAARAIHNSGRRAGGPFLALNCRSIPRELVLGEFLGFEAGAFNSGPSGGQSSKFELADGGTLYLDEVETLPVEAQSALARVIESGEVIRLGGTRVIPVDVRIIASTESRLEAGVADSTFNATLFYRLSAFAIELPALREHPEDIALLVERFLERLSLQMTEQVRIGEEALDALRNYPWPGNITELESALERAALHCKEKTIEPEDLPEPIRYRRLKTPGRPVTEPVKSLAEAERHAIIAAGRASKGNLSKTAQLLGIARTTLWRKMREARISPLDFK